MKEETLLGRYETMKFDARRGPYRDGLDTMFSLGFSNEDYLHHFPAFVGHLTLARFLALYEAYKMTLGVAGHVAEVGVFKGAGSLLFAKLAQIFEPQSLTLVHGFDWFRGIDPAKDESRVPKGHAQESKERLLELIRCQGLGNVLHIHDLDVTHDLERFFEQNPSMHFKLVFLDIGTYEPSKAALRHFWPRLTPGGVLVFDEYNHELGPGETRAVREVLPRARIETFPFAWMPTAYVRKEA
ncbi:MAG: class I SAM-dependent methyltransferase, partial [Dehalococcoidia bacterium]